ncbi:MAG: diaminopimelate decarboxylase [Elusimicrobia bacterium HGW-Elusimicrobia-1]|jgi:diaminopimelate decarboxylase|nr:MAG: diaminopimelate decarboxylase [Elusimicrobia bacterium HGW-Elusimicrobia-1]
MNPFVYKNRNLCVDGISLKSIARKVGTPFFIYSRDNIERRILDYKKGLASVRHLLCYAVKANSNPAVLKVIRAAGCGADITSGGELYAAMAAGISPSKLVYAGVGKTDGEIRAAIKAGILMFNVESRAELEAIDGIAARAGKIVRVAVRINPDVDAGTHKKITTGKSRTKFGIPISDALEFYNAARRMKHIEPAGIHSHIGSQIVSTSPFTAAARKIKKLTDRLESSGLSIKYVDLGGGLGIRYNDENPPSPSTFVKETLSVFSSDRDAARTYIFEPGRSIVGEAGALVASVIYHKEALGKHFFIADAGMSDLIRPTLYDAYHEILPVEKSASRVVTADIVGPICETGDFLGLSRRLPILKKNDLIAVLCAGAYGFAMSSRYNSRLRAAEVLVSDGKYKIVRKRETYADLDARV